MSKCDFNKLDLDTLTWEFSCKFAAHFQKSFPQEGFWTAASGGVLQNSCS